MPPRTLTCFIFLFGLFSALSLPAQTKAGEADLRTGLSLFKQEDYRRALVSFQNIIADPTASDYAPDAYFWSAKVRMALDQLEDAGRDLDYFLAHFPGHPYYSEALYQKGRLLYLQKDYEGSIRVLQEFLRYYPKSDFVPNALFWAGDSLYCLGKLGEAARVFNKVLQEHPQSFKVEAARYRLTLIDFKRRENELMRLLKWSHEEFLKTVEEFQRREKTYEQAIAAYQKAMGGPKAQAEKAAEESAGTVEPLQAENAALKARIQDLQSQSAAKLEALQAENAALKARLQDLQSQPSAKLEELQAENAALRAQLQDLQPQLKARIEELDKLERALRIKAEALSLKEALLLRYEESEKKSR
ncbi:MAG: tetratricopeptide repeat protein [candidate division WOR-3 bacterium]